MKTRPYESVLSRISANNAVRVLSVDPGISAGE